MGKGVQYTNYAWEGGGTAHITLFHDLLKGCVKYFISTERYIDTDLLQTNDTAFILIAVSQYLCDAGFPNAQNDLHINDRRAGGGGRLGK